MSVMDRNALPRSQALSSHRILRREPGIEAIGNAGHGPRVPPLVLVEALDILDPRHCYKHVV